jgi:hypothetical protein
MTGTLAWSIGRWTSRSAERETMGFVADDDRIRSLGFGHVEHRSPRSALLQACPVRDAVSAEWRRPLMVDRATDVVRQVTRSDGGSERTNSWNVVSEPTAITSPPAPMWAAHPSIAAADAGDGSTSTTHLFAFAVVPFRLDTLHV